MIHPSVPQIAEPNTPVQVIEEAGQPSDHDLMIGPRGRQLCQKCQARLLLFHALEDLQIDSGSIKAEDSER